MKKIFSLFMVAAIVLTMSFAAMAAEPVSGMKFVVTETDSDITVSVVIGNFSQLNGYTASLATTAVTRVENSVVNKLDMENCKETIKDGIIQYAVSTTDTSKYLTNAGDVEALTFKVVKVDESKQLSAADFAHASTTLNYSKMTCPTGGVICGITSPGNNFTNKKQASYFTVEYVDARTPAPEEPEVDAVGATESEINATQDWTSGEFKYPTDTAGSTDNAAVGKKVAAFGKANVGLTAGNYGVKIGNRYYPGKMDVPADSLFAIIVVNTDGDDAIEGSYTYDIYTGTDANPTWVATGLSAVVK